MKRIIVIGLLTSFYLNAGASQQSPDLQYPDPNRWVEAVSEYQKWDSKNACPQNAILFFGSSSIVGWKTADSFPGLPVINRGFGGSYTRDAVFYVNELAIKYAPAVIVIYEGDNDIAGAIPPASVHNDFVRLTETIHAALPKTEIICLAAKICRHRWDWRNAVTELNDLNRNLCQTKDYLTFVDTASALLTSGHTPDARFFLADQLHLNDAGYARWNALLAPVLKQRYAVHLQQADE